MAMELKEGSKVIIYARVSTYDQNVQQQVYYLKQWCSRQGYEVITSIADEESGRLPLKERKRFRKLLELLPEEAQAIVVYKLDRLTRNWDDVTYIERYFRNHWDELRLVSASESVDLGGASGRFLFRVMMAQCCFMPEDMMEKQRIGIDRAKAEGKYMGRKPGALGKQKE